MLFLISISILVILASILTLTVKNPVHSVFFLILVFCGISALTCSLQISFLGIIFIIVYVGAIAVLFLFVIMMLNVRYLELKENYLRYLPISLILVFIFLLQFIYLFRLNYTSAAIKTIYIDWLTVFNLELNIKSIGYVLYTYFFSIFLLASCILLLAMVGSIILTLNQNFQLKRQNILKQVNRNIYKSILIKT